MAKLEPAYLVLGTERAKIATTLKRIRAYFPPEAVETLPAQTGSSAALVAGFGMLGLLAERRLVIVTSAHDWPKDDVSAIVSYLASPSPDLVLLLVADRLAGNSRLRKAFTGPQVIECPGPSTPDELRRWVEARFKADGAQVERQAVTRLIELCCGIDPSDAKSVRDLDAGALDRVRTDVERITTYAASDPITVALVDELATRSTDDKVYALGDAWAARDRPAFLELVISLLAQREHPVRLVGSLGRHLRAVNDAHHLLRSMAPQQALDTLVSNGANQWGAKKVVQHAQRVGTAQVDAALSRIALLDAELKGANALSGRIGGDAGAGARVVLQRGLLELV